MSNLQNRQEKIQAKRKQTPWRDFVMEIWSRISFGLQKNNWFTSRYPDSERIWNLTSIKDFLEYRDKQIYREYNSWDSFFHNYKSLYINSKKSSVYHLYGNNENADYADWVFWTKNAYLSFICGASVENICYSIEITTWSTNIYNSLYCINNSTNNYMTSFVNNGFQIFYSYHILSSSNIWFCNNMIWCNECIFCNNLTNMSYCIENIQYPQKEYFDKKYELLQSKHLFDTYYNKVNTQWNNYNSNNVVGSWILHSENVEQWYGVTRTTNAKNVIFAYSVEHNNNNFYDWFDIGINCSDFYGVLCAWTNSSHFYCSTWCWKSHNLYYCENCEQCSFCLWCYGLINKSYCILNKQYSKEERYAKVDEIFTQMEKDWQLWEFFPATMNPFYFNDTAAYLIDPSFTKEEVTAKWYLRRDEPIKVDIPEWMEIVKTSELWEYEWFDVEWNWIINADILKKVIQDEEWNVYRIIPMEYKFLVKHGLPLPRKHWLERMKENFRIQ
jgi:hypothetical protein